MTADVCECGHLRQTHRGQCSSPSCGCPAFVSEEPPVQLDLLVAAGRPVCETTTTMEAA